MWLCYLTKFLCEPNDAILKIRDPEYVAVCLYHHGNKTLSAGTNACGRATFLCFIMENIFREYAILASWTKG